MRLLCCPLLDGYVLHTVPHIPVFTRQRSDKALANARDLQSLNLELKLLFLRASPIKERCSMVDAAPNPARTLLRSSPRAHPEVGTLLVAVSREMAVCTCQPAVVREVPRGESTLRELVLRSSFGDTLTVFAQSGVLRSRFFP